jgi:hypothetical protein
VYLAHVRWQSGLHNSTSIYLPTPEAGFISLFPGLLGILGDNMDLLDRLLYLLESYLLLDPNLPQAYPICLTLAKALGASKTNTSSIRRLLFTLSLLVRTTPLSTLAPQLLDSGIFQHILTALEDDKASGLILAAYLEILSRIAMIDPNIFLQLVAHTGAGEKPLEVVLDALWRNFDYVGEVRMRKAVAMGAGALLTTVGES